MTNQTRGFAGIRGVFYRPAADPFYAFRTLMEVLKDVNSVEPRLGKNPAKPRYYPLTHVFTGGRAGFLRTETPRLS